MVKTSLTKIQKTLFFLYLVFFPFGQLLRTSVFTGNQVIVFNLVDIIAILAVVAHVLSKNKINDKKFDLSYFTLIFYGIFSILVSVSVYKNLNFFFGILYLIRLLVYFLFFKLIRGLYSGNEKIFVVQTVFIALIAFVFFGWFQYFFFPDLTSLKSLGWDDHLYRLMGTLFDPGFSSILLVFGSLISIFLYYFEKNKTYLITFAIFVLSTLFTYSRAGYLAMVFGLITFFVIKKSIKTVVLILVIIFITILFLPRPAGQGVKLERTYSIFSRLNDYRLTFEIFKEDPLLGIGYNNLCYKKYLINDKTDITSHSCGGSDSSILLLLSTLGVVGFILFINFTLEIINESLKSKYKILLLSIGVSLLVHSQFNNSLFYPWVLGSVAIIFSLL